MLVKNQGTKQGEQRSLGDCWQWKANGQCSKGDNCSFRHDMDKRAKTTQPNPSPGSSSQQNVENASRTRSPKGRNPSGKMARLACKVYLRGTCTTPFCEKWHPPECLFYKFENGCRVGEKCSYAHHHVDEQPSKRSKKNGAKSAVAMLKISQQLGCVFQDMEPPKSSSILRKSSNIRKPFRCFRFTTAALHHANIWDKNPSLGVICPGDPHQRNPNAPKYEDRSQEETEWQERCAREAAWRLAKKYPEKLKEKHKTAFFSPSENWCLPTSSTLRPKGREFFVDSGASIDAHGQQKGFEFRWIGNFTANGEVQTNEEATVYVKELDIFLTMKVLEDTPAVSSLGSFAMNTDTHTCGSTVKKPHLLKNGIRSQCNTENFVPILILSLSTNSSSSFPSSTSMTPSRQERNNLTSSSSSSTSPTMIVSSDSETRATADMCGIDSYPAAVSSSHVKRKARGDPLTKRTKNPKPKKNEDHDLERGEALYFDLPEWLQEFRENLVDDRVLERNTPVFLMNYL